MHQYFRNKHGSGQEKWRYFSIDEFITLHGIFDSFDYTTFGFSGCFGVNETMKSILGYVDLILEPFVPRSCNYIIAGVATKK
jgi:hypothetical protein